MTRLLKQSPNDNFIIFAKFSWLFSSKVKTFNDFHSNICQGNCPENNFDTRNALTLVFSSNMQ